MIDVDGEPVVALDGVDEFVGDIHGHLLHLAAGSAHQVKVTMTISQVVGG